MTAQINFNTWGKPAETETVFLLAKKGCLGQVHLLRHVLHPNLIPCFGENADCSRIAGKWLISKSIDLKNL
jgi:hypothetical protein